MISLSPLPSRLSRAISLHHHRPHHHYHHQQRHRVGACMSDLRIGHVQGLQAPPDQSSDCPVNFRYRTREEPIGTSDPLQYTLQGRRGQLVFFSYTDTCCDFSLRCPHLLWMIACSACNSEKQGAEDKKSAKEAQAKLGADNTSGRGRNAAPP